MRKLKNLAKVLLFLLILVFIGYFCYTCGRVNEAEFEEVKTNTLYALHSIRNEHSARCGCGIRIP